MARLNKGLIYTNDNCIGCNRCISGCPVMGANISSAREGKNYIMVDGSKCIHCGHCISMCKHQAREYIDDTDLFFKELRSGERISLAVAPSFYMNFKDQAKGILGYLKSLGVEHIYNVSFGADIATWAYLTSQKQNLIPGAISSSCPAVVNYIEKRKPELLSKLMPVKSPLMCLATYLREYVHYDGKLAFISPCIAKKDEMEHSGNQGAVQYNVTYEHLKKVCGNIPFEQYHSESDLDDFGLGNIFPVSGGLKKNIENFIEDEQIIWEMNGVSGVYPCMNQYEKLGDDKIEELYLYDILNCQNGCTNGPGIGEQKEEFVCSMENEFRLKEGMKKVQQKGTPFDKNLSCAQRFQKLQEIFTNLKLQDFLISYENRFHEEKTVTSAKMEAIYRSLHKIKQADRLINCQSCGYKSCEQMAQAIALGYNVITNCVHYAKDENMRMLMTERLTGIPSLFAFEKFLNDVIQAGKAKDYAIVYFNIKNFTLINEQFGTNGGDDALKEYAINAIDCINADEMIARMGGNNFIVAVRRAEYNSRIKALNSIALHLNKENHRDTYPVSIRGGIYFLCGDENASVAINRSAIAFSIARKTENIDFAYFDEKIKTQMFDEMMLGRSLPKALENDEFVVYYQPKVSIQGRKLMGAEALVRWKTKDGMIPPNRFIPLCEKNGFVKKIDFFVLNRVCSDLRRWIDMGMTPVRISSNFSTLHFTEPGIAGHILEIVDSWKIPHDLIEVEFTETAYLDGQSNLEMAILQLKDYGFHSSMDDFGSGYSSLNLLQNLNFDVLKLDKSLLGDNINSEKTQRVIANVIHMAKELHMEIIAEGVETSEEYDFLRNLKCDLIQGYIFDRPLPETEFLERLNHREYK